MVVFWKEYSGRQLRLITPENGGGDETSSPSPPRFTFFDDPSVPLGPADTPPETSPGPLDSLGLPPGLPPAPPPAGGRGRERAENASLKGPDRVTVAPVHVSPSADEDPAANMYGATTTTTSDRVK